jgi:hypothetical protein
MDTNCPYCDAEIEINHDDGYGYEEDGRHEQECGECENTFTFTTSILYCYETEKAECLNGGDHKYKKTTTCPEEFSKMRCTMCDMEREMTDEERTSFGIGTRESYFERLK